MSMDDLDRLPVAELRETFWYREYWLNGQLIERKHVLRVLSESARSHLSILEMRLRGQIAFRLLRGFAEPCPHCKKLIELSPWRDPFKGSGDE